jgi:hypothetical protein
VITQTRRGGGVSSSRPRSESKSGSPIDPSKYYITLEPDGESIKIHRPSNPIVVREGDHVTGVRYINATKNLTFKLKKISFDREHVITKLTFKFIHEGKSISPTFHIDEKVIKFENLRGGISVPSHQLSALAKYIKKAD